MKLTKAAIILPALWALCPCATPLLAQEKVSPQLRQEIQKIVRAEIQKALAKVQHERQAPKVVYEAPRVPKAPKAPEAPKAPKAPQLLKVTRPSTVYEISEKTEQRKKAQPQQYRVKKTEKLEKPRTYILQGSKVLSDSKSGHYRITGQLDASVRRARASIDQALEAIRAAKGLSRKQRAGALKGLEQARKALGGIKKVKEGDRESQGLRILESKDGRTLQLKGFEMPELKHQVKILMDKAVKVLEPKVLELHEGHEGKVQLEELKPHDVQLHILTPESESKSKKVSPPAKKKAPKRSKRRIVI